MSQSGSTCLICGSTRFESSDGAKICVECGGHEIDFVDLIDEFGEVWELRREEYYNSKTFRPVGGILDSASSPDWCSFEAFNIILKKWTDTLVHFGASPKFKDTVFKLWIRYLQERKVAFVNKDSENVTEKSKRVKLLLRRDAVKLEGLIVEKKEKKQKESQEEAMKDIKKRVDRERNRAAKHSLYQAAESSGHTRSFTYSLAASMSATLDATKILKDMDDVNNEVDLLEATMFESKPLILEDDVAEKTFSIATEVRAEVEGGTSVEAKKTIPYTLKRKLILENDEKNQANAKYTSHYLNLPKLLSLVYLALLISGEDILLLDLLRWCREGYLPYQSAGYLVPLQHRFSGSDFFLFNQSMPPAADIRGYAAYLAGYLSVQAVPMPSVQACLDKMCKALYLPDDIKASVLHVMDNFALKRFSTLHIPPVDVMVAAAILLAFKVAFGLDGVHEELLSELAAKVNRGLEAEGNQLRLFSWTEWHCHMNRVNWWMSETCVQSLSLSMVRSRKEVVDAKRFNDYVWAQGIYKIPVKDKSSRRGDQVTWDYSLLNYALSLNMQSLKRNVKRKPMFDVYRVPNVDPVMQYLSLGFLRDKSENMQRSHKVSR